MRIRTIKPEFWTSESIGRLSRDARLLFIALWSFADDSGKGRGAFATLSGALFPFDRDAMERMPSWFDELEREGMAKRYVASDGNTYYMIPKWLKHQKIEKPSQSRIPDFTEPSPSPPRILPDISPTGPRTLDLGPCTKDQDQIHTPPKNSASDCASDDRKPWPGPDDEPPSDQEPVIPEWMDQGQPETPEPDPEPTKEQKTPEQIQAEKDRDEKFERWFDKYGKRVGKKPAKKKWDKLKPEDHDKCLAVVDAYVKSRPDVQFRKDPTTYLNQECFNDDIPNGGGRFTKDGLPIDANGYPDVARMLQLGIKIEGMG